MMGFVDHLHFSGPPEPMDDKVRRALRREQGRDKGFGPALGGDAPRYLVARLSALGFAVTTMPSAWRLDASASALGDALIAGWSEAAARQSPRHAGEFADWAARRRGALADGELRIEVGHVDVFGAPVARKSRS